MNLTFTKMRKLALLIVCSACFASMGSFVLAQTPVNVSLNVTNTGDIRPARVEAQVEIEGVREFDYMKIQSADKYATVKIGYSEHGIYKESIDLRDGGIEFVDITLKDLSGSTDWSRIMLSINDSYPRGTVAIGNYFSDAEDLGNGWFKVRIPLSDITSSIFMTHFAFPHANYVNVGVKEITLTGTGTPLQWFGDCKHDNAIKENAAGTSELLFKSGGISVEEVRLKMINQGNVLVKSSMPFGAFSPTLTSGENKLLGIVMDINGDFYYSDTVIVNVPEGLTYDLTHVTCNGGADGAIDITVDGGTMPYTYNWSHGADTEDLSDISAGLYHLMVTDVDGKTATISIEVKESNALKAELTSYGCSETEAMLNISGGIAPYKYSIDGGAFMEVGGKASKVWEIKTDKYPDEDLKANYATALGKDKNDNVYVSGDFADVLNYGEVSVGEEGKYGTYLVKFNADGSFAWSFTSLAGRVKDLAVDQNGNSILMIQVSGTAWLVDHNNMMLSKGSYIIKIDANGNFQWIETSVGRLNLVAVDGSENVYVVGTQDNYLSPPGQGPSDIYLSKYNNDGMLLWTKILMGNNVETANDLFVNTNGDIYITGGYTADINFDGIKLKSGGGEDIFIARLDNNGNTIWAKSRGGAGGDNGRDLVADEKGNLFATALFSANSGFPYNTSIYVITRMKTSDGSVVWDRPYQHGGYPNFAESYSLVVGANDQIYLSAHGGGIIKKDGEEFPVINDETLLLQFDYDGNINSLLQTGQFSYEPELRGSPITVTRDNHVIYTELLNKFTIVKSGAAMSKKVEISTVNDNITVKDANSCTYTLFDPSFEKLPPAQPMICYVTPTYSGSGNLLFWTTGEDQEITSFNIYRETYALGEFEQIGSVEVGVNQFVDETIDILERSYRYVVTAVDNCDNESDYSESHQTMHLTVNEGNRGQVNLIWDGYQGFEYKSFYVYRGSSDQDMELLTQLPSYLFTYTDFDSSPSTLYYQIRVESDQDCIPNGTTTVAAGRQVNESTARMVASNIAARFGQAGELSFYPNPGDDVVHAKFSPDGDEYQLRVIDASGRVVRSVDHVFDKATIERGNLPAGIYTVVLSKNTGEPMRGRIIFR